MASARILTLCDQLVTDIAAAWPAAATPPDEVSRQYIAPVDVEELHTLIGRHVWVFPSVYDNNPENRAEDRWNYEIAVLILERYTPQGPPPVDWLDTLVDFVEDTVSASVDFDGRTLLEFAGRRLWTENISTVIYDVEMLNQKKIFWSELTVKMHELAPG